MENEIEFTGIITETEVLKLLGKADIFVLPSFSEGISVAIMEAMAMEVPVIACSVSSVPELIEQGCEGLLVPRGI